MVGEEEGERVAAIRQAFQADREKLGKIKALLVHGVNGKWKWLVRGVVCLCLRLGRIVR